MLEAIRAALMSLLPGPVRMKLPTTDRRRTVQWGVLAVAVFMLVLGRFALFSPIDTLFSQSLARMGLQDSWGVVMIASGVCLAASTITPWRLFQVLSYGVSGLVLCWTYILVGWVGKISTPTVDACLGVGIVMLLATVSKARQSVCVRARDKAARYGINTY